MGKHDRWECLVDIRNTGSGSYRSWICSNVSDQVYHQRRDCGYKKSVQYCGEADRQ